MLDRIPPSNMYKRNEDATTREAHLFIAMAGAALDEGETVRDVVCPFCLGGQSKEKAFALTREGNIFKYICHRASCGKKGYVDRRGSLVAPDKTDESKTVPVKNEARKYYGTFSALENNQVRLLCSKYGLTPNELSTHGVKYAPQAKRYAWPVYGPHWQLRGYMLHSLENYRPKWDGYKYLTDEPWMCWYKRPGAKFIGPGDPLVVVEDQISALKVSRQYEAAALLGVELNHLKIQELLDRGRPMVWALDADAYNKAIRTINEWRFYLNKQARVVQLSKDLKYEPDGRINSIISSAMEN